MADKRLTRQCQQSANDEPQQKSQNRDENNDAEVVEPKTLTNIYYDCLERIFDFSDVESLFNVARTCKRLQIAAAAKFGDDYDQDVVWFTLYMHRAPIIFRYPNRIVVNDNDYAEAYIRNGHLDRYINQYCADTLKSIDFRSRRVFSTEFSPYLKPFKSVANVTVVSQNLGNKLPYLTEWFPNVRDLRMYSVSMDVASSAVFFPKLKSFVFGLSDVNHAENTLTTENIVSFLHINPQLQTLAFVSDLPWNETLNTISRNPSILKLKIYDLYIDEDITLNDLLFTANEVIMLIRQLKSLKKFKFNVKDQTECDRLLNQLDAKWQRKVERNYFNAFETTITLNL